ncbi:UNVERIFIED_CONTAM: hypothetical protein HDU68_010857 [Siphonaria sp. JEL0065]|nr:hypothetical protein HDU68_010857 [Siphonaria sp. JEL0065]
MTQDQKPTTKPASLMNITDTDIDGDARAQSLARMLVKRELVSKELKKSKKRKQSMDEGVEVEDIGFASPVVAKRGRGRGRGRGVIGRGGKRGVPSHGGGKQSLKKRANKESDYEIEESTSDEDCESEDYTPETKKTRPATTTSNNSNKKPRFVR